jgi:tetratricopeptide (TPR) repeat protein
MTEPSLPEESLFAQALEITSADERAAFLDRACGNNPALRAEVEALLRAHELSGDLLDLPENVPVTANDLPAGEGPGAILGKYKLLEQIGEGGMGAVWMAEQTQPIHRRVAVKVIKQGMDSREVLARFEAERQALALMDHPNIAKVLDADRTPSGRPYFVMELVKGQPITRYCDEKRLGVRQRLGLFADVCRAVQHAHQKGIIHRDLKPSNVLVAPYDGKPVVKVIDFGVAKATGQRLTGLTLFTGFGALVGTPEYMSPEQAEVNNQDIDTRSDIYSLGVLLYELLTGSTPLTRQRIKGAALLEVLRVIREEEPRRPSTRLSESKEALPSISAQRQTEPAKLTRLVRGELDWIVMKALEKDRNRRYETASAFALDVQRYLADEPVLACPPSAGYRLRKFARRNRGKLALAAGVFLALTVMAASIGWALHDRAEREAESQRLQSARQAQVTQKVRESWNAARTLLDENKVAAARQKLVEAQAQWGTDRPALADLAAEVEVGLAELDRFQQFLDLVDRAHESEAPPFINPEFRTSGEGAGAGTTAAAAPPGWRPAAAVPFVLKALAQYGVLERKDWTTALAGGFLSRAQVEQVRHLVYEELILLADDLLRRYEEHPSGHKLSAQAAARKALVYLSKAEKAHQPTQVFYSLRADCRKALGEEEAYQADRKIADAMAPTIALDYYRQGLVATDRRQAAEAIEAFEAALQLEPAHYWSLMHLGYVLAGIPAGREDFTGAAHVFSACLMKRPDHVHAYLFRAAMYSRLGRYKRALADSSRALELDPKELIGWNTRAGVYCKLGQYDRALADYSRAIEIDATFAPAWNDRGALYLEPLHQPEKAVADLTQALKLDATLVPAWLNRAAAYRKLGQPDKGITDCSQAIKLAPNVAPARFVRGRLYAELGRHDKALADFTRAIDLDPKFAQAWNGRGAAYAELRQLDRALADYSRAIALDGKFTAAWYNRGNAYTKLNQLDKAIADLSRALQLDEKLALAWHVRGLAYTLQGQMEKAVADLSRFLELAPKQSPLLVQTYRLRAHANHQLGHFDQVLKDYRAILKLDPDNAAIHNQLAWLLATCQESKLRDPSQAVERARDAVRRAPQEGNYWQTLGVAHYRAGDPKAAAAALEKSVELRKGGDAADGFFLAMTRQKLGDPVEARKQYDQAVQWMQKNNALLSRDKMMAETLRRFQAEAEEVLELKKK